MSWERFWVHVKARNYADAKADLRDYDRVFNAEPTVSQSPTSALLDRLESQQYDVEYNARLRAEILRRCTEGPEPFAPKMAKDDYAASRKRMIRALLSILSKQ